MQIKRIKIEKFRAIENLEFEFGTGIIAFCGENGIGKTTMLDAILWILTDETLINGKDNQTNLDDKDNNKPISIELEIEKSDGSTLCLKRSYGKKTNKQGVFTDFANKFWINEAPYSSTDYFKRLTAEFGIEAPQVKKFNVLRALIDFDYFGTIDYKVAREVIENILHLETAGDIINREDYMLIKNDLIGQNYDITRTRTMYSKQIDAKTNDIDNLKTRIKTLIETDVPIDTKRRDELISMIESLKLKTYEHSAEYKAIKNNMNESLNETNQIWNELNALKKQLSMEEMKNNNVITPLEANKKEIEKLRSDYNAIKNTIVVCPNCKAPLNENEIKAKLLKISNRGKELKQLIADLESQLKTDVIDEIKSKINEKENEYKVAMQKQDEIRIAYNNIAEKEDMESNSYYRVKQEELDKLNAELNLMDRNSNKDKIKENQDSLARIQEELAKLYLKKELLTDFEKDKINEINGKVKDAFPNIEFVLIETSETGAETKTCKPTFNGTDYLRLNDGQRIKMGFEIIKGLSNAFKVKEQLPIVFDKLKDLDKRNIVLLKENNNDTQIFTTFVSNEYFIKVVNI